MTRRRLAYLCLETPREGQAVHTHVHEIIAGLRSTGWSVELFATTDGGASAGASYRRRLEGYVSVQRELWRRFDDFDAIYMRAHFAALPSSRMAVPKGKPVFQEINGKPADIGVTYTWMRPFMGAIAGSYRAQLRSASHIFAVTPGLKEWAVAEAGHDRVSMVPNGANTELFAPEGETAGLPYPYVVFVGGLVAWHGIETMLSAVESASWPRGVKLVVIGDGVKRDKVAAAARKGAIEWLGRKPYSEIPAYVRGAIAALCVIEDPDGRSAAGVAPLKLFEALACGVPVIVSDLPYQAELVRSKKLGQVVQRGSPHAIAVAVAAIVADPHAARRVGHRAAEFARASVSWQARAASIGDIMAKTIDASR